MVKLFLIKNKMYFSTTLSMSECEKQELNASIKPSTQKEEIHDNTIGRKNKRIHFHCALKVSENTFGAQLYGVVLRYVEELDSKNNKDYENRKMVLQQIKHFTME